MLYQLIKKSTISWRIRLLNNWFLWINLLIDNSTWEILKTHDVLKWVSAQSFDSSENWSENCWLREWQHDENILLYWIRNNIPSESWSKFHQALNSVQILKLFKLIISKQKSPAGLLESQFVLSIVKQFLYMTRRRTPIEMCRHFTPHSARLQHFCVGVTQ